MHSASRPAGRLVLLAVMTLVFVLAAVATAVAAPLAADTIPKYDRPVIVPPAMPMAEQGPDYLGPRNYDYYEIAVRQFEQQVLPETFPATTVWSYGPAGDADFSRFNFPAFTIEAKVDRGVRVKWVNDLVDDSGNFLPHLLPVDQTLHWANPPAGEGLTDMEGTSQEPYDGPVPIVTHVHGAHTYEESDGYPEAWYLPNANDIPAGYAMDGNFYEGFKAEAEEGGPVWQPGTSVFSYPNEQRATTLWYHDHSLGITRLNVYAGPAGFYLLRGGPDDVVMTTGGEEAVLPGPAPGVGDDPFGEYREIPLAIQDRSFDENGSLYYPDNRAFFEGLEPGELGIPFAPDSDIKPLWLPEFFPTTMVVNGRTWPYLEVQPKRYRLRLLNGSQSRFIILNLTEAGSMPTAYPDGATAEDLPEVDLPMWQIGAEGGFLESVVQQGRLLLGPAERADVIVDFSGYAPGDEIIMANTGPDDPFGGGQPFVDYDPANPATTGQVMKFTVVASDGQADNTTPPEELVLPDIDWLPGSDETRHLSLNEGESDEVYVEVDGATGEYILDGTGTVVAVDPETDTPGEGNEFVPFAPAEALLGTYDPATDTITPLDWDEALTETPQEGEVETWMLHNFTEDAHPIHIHLVQFEVVERKIEGTNSPNYTGEEGGEIGDARDPEPGEVGFKDTIIVYPGESATVKMRFDIAGIFVWHCHILEHEDNEMMRPYAVSAANANVDNYPDVPLAHEFATAIEVLTEADVVSGYENGSFGLFDEVLRAQLAKMVVNAWDYHDEDVTNSGSPTFPDVPMSLGVPYPYDYVEEAAENDLVLGYENGNFGPYDDLTRVQLVRILVRAAGDRLADPDASYVLPFTDVSAMDRAVVAKAHFNGLIDGKTATIFDPYGTATRGQASKIMYNALMQ